MPTIRERLEENIALACMGFAVTGFTAGFAADRVLIERSNQVLVVKDSFVDRHVVETDYMPHSVVAKDYVARASIVGVGDGTCESRQKLVEESAFKAGAQAIEARFIPTSHKGGRASVEVGLPRLKRAVFASIMDVNASTDVLKGSLEHLSTTQGNRVSDFKDAVVGDFSRLLRVRYQWLTESVKPALARDAATMSPEEQRSPSAEVDMPAEFDILPGSHGKERFSDPHTVEKEVDLLRIRLSSR